MNVTIYKTADAANVVNKALTDGTQIQNVKPYEPCDISTPTLILNYTNTLSGYNYIYIPSFGRYYFISDITMLTGNMCLLHCNVDVLYTYREQIRACRGVVLRSESIGAPTIYPDNKLPVLTNKKDAQHITIDDENNEFSPVATYSYLLGVLNRKDDVIE